MSNSPQDTSKISRRSSFKRKIAFFFGVILIALAFIFYTIKKNNQYTVDTSRSIEHTQNVLLNAEQLRSQFDEVQSSIRGFIITGDKQYLEVYNSAQANISKWIRLLKNLTNDNPAQQIRIDSLARLAVRFKQQRESLIQLRIQKGFEPAKNIFLTGEGAVMTDQARGMILSMQQDENILLLQRKAANERSIRNSTNTISIFILFSVLLLVAALIFIYRNSKLRNLAEEKIRMINASLEKTIEQKTSEALKKEFQYRFLIENMREGIQVIGFDWRYLFLNKAVVEHSKFSRKELLGHTMIEKYPGIEKTRLFGILQRCMEQRKSEIFENEFVYPDGKKQWFELSIQPVPEGLFILSIDVTDQKKAELELIEQQLQFQKSITEITIKAQEKERNELGKELHDNINQILATAKLFLSMAKTGDGNPDEWLERGNEYISSAIEEIRKLSHTLVSPSLGDVSLDEVLQELAQEVSLVNGLHVEFVNQSANNSLLNKEKELMLYRIAQEQINNIRKYSKAKKANIILNSDDERIYFSISDNGIGFDTSKRGKGIGLQNIQSRVEFYSGKMKLVSAPGKGCRLEIEVPV